MRRPLFILILTLLVVPISLISAQDDGIPDNCEYQYADYYRPNLFPRYEPQNRRLLLVDWTTGAEVAVLGTDLDDTLIRAWSVNCRYLAVATGSTESRDTVVYDTVDLRQVGSVPDARGAAHPITWGPGEFLVVEGRNGAVLWNVPANIQYPLAVSFNTTTYRNFSRLRWDEANHLLTANLAVGGRIVIDLNTGEQTSVALTQPGVLVLGGESFNCVPTRGERGGAQIDSLYLYYTTSGGVLNIGRGVPTGSRESLVTLDANLPPPGVGTYIQESWSINCRYVSATLASSEENTFDTVIWDVLNQNRIGTFPDARDVGHRLTWDTAEKHVLIETRDGAYLWNLETNERILVNDQVQQPTDCAYDYYWRGECQPISFHAVYWDAGRQKMLGVPVQAPNAIVAYDVNTGAEVTRYTVEGAVHPLDFITSNDSRWIAAYADGQVTLWDRNGSSAYALPVVNADYFNFRNSVGISTDSRFLVLYRSQFLDVWDLNGMSTNASPLFTHSRQGFYGSPVFVNGDTISNNFARFPQWMNVVTGEISGAYTQINDLGQVVQAYTALSGTSGDGVRGNYGYDLPDRAACPFGMIYRGDTRQLVLHNFVTDEYRVIESNLNAVHRGDIGISPNCQTIYALVYVNNADLPYDEAPANEIYYDHATEMILWDVQAGERIATLDNPPDTRYGYRYPFVVWSPGSDRALVGVRTRFYLVEPATNSILPVRFQDTDLGELPTGAGTYWDYERGTVFVQGYGEVFAIDMRTGSERLRFPARENRRGGCARWGCDWEIQGAWLYIYGIETVSVWNVDTLQHAIVSPGDGYRARATLSPDGRYLVTWLSFVVQVWDTNMLADNVRDQQPTYEIPFGSTDARSIRFLDATTIEISTGAGVLLYDVTTGQQR